MERFTVGQKLHFTLRVAVAMCFIGHGAFGIITKPIWCNYFAVLGIGHDLAYRLMPVLGTFDILLGVIMLVYPIRAIPLWLVIWGAVTALLRPLSGEPFAEFIERAGNFGAPLALLIMSGMGRLFTRIRTGRPLEEETLAKVVVCLRIVAFLLLVGHGWLNVIGKKGLLGQYTSIGLSHPQQIALTIGLLEIMAGALVLVRPFRSLVLVLLVWKMASELFYPHYELIEWIERGGSYGVLLALYFVTDRVGVARQRQDVLAAAL
jgi:uncharacterized membrane protein YphA (DoxX/SURF4 family)